MKSTVLITIITVSLLQVTRAKDDCVTTAAPDFRAPGRRISDQKCREYNWERKQLEKCSTSKGTEVNEYPYMGALGYKDKEEWSFKSTAFLVSPKFAITAAHAVKSPVLDGPEIIRLGNENIVASVPRIDVKIIKKIVHPDYKVTGKSFDIALLELEYAVPLSRGVLPACLWTQPEINSDHVGIVPAWGYDRTSTKPEDRAPPASIQTMNVEVINPEMCLPLVEQYYNRHFTKLEDHHLCANESLQDGYFCVSSSGAPIISSVVLDGGDKVPFAQGVTSFGFGCHQMPSIGIYTRISSFVDWIEEIVWKTA